MTKRKFIIVDLFCGGGGFTTAARLAAERLGFEVEIIAINHWQTAINTHSYNHPNVTHYMEDVAEIDPRKVVPGGVVDLLLASPECIHHSNARGGRPMNDQSRSSAWHLLRWVNELYVRNVLIENVPEFETWGPLGANGRPIESKRGALFAQFVGMLRATDYTVGWRVLNAADYGAATTRKRLFIQARRGGRSLAWPLTTYIKPLDDQLNILAGSNFWRPAREIIDWDLPGKSIYFERTKPLRPKTMRRIIAGVFKFSGMPFIVAAGGPEGQARNPQSIKDPIGAILTYNRRALIEPWIVILQNNRDAMSIGNPLPTVLTSGAHFGLADASIIPLTHSGGEDRSHSTKDPLPTVTCATRGELALSEWLVKYFEGSDAVSVNHPLPSVTASYEHLALAQCLVKYHGDHVGQNDSERRTHDVRKPIPTLDTSNRFGLMDGYLLPHQHGASSPDNVQSLGKPMPSITATSSDMFTAQPFLISYYGNGSALSANDPLDTVTTKDRFALVSPDLIHMLDKGQIVGLLDIKFRMLQPHELSAAMGFPKSYHFVGNRADQVKQIGNAVEVNVAAALVGAILESEARR